MFQRRDIGAQMFHDTYPKVNAQKSNNQFNDNVSDVLVGYLKNTPPTNYMYFILFFG